MQKAQNDIQFLAGGGEMGELTRQKDWSNTPLGIPKKWPQSLRTTLGILLNSKFPMFLFWGNDLTCFYNDAYRPSLGKEGKHPAMLGMKAIDAWPEIWDTIKPMIDHVLSTGVATWHEDLLMPIYRNHTIEDVYWTFSYSPVYDESTSVAGVLVTCTETTEKVLSLKKTEQNEQRLNIVIEASELGTWDWNLKTKEINYSQRYLEIIGGYTDKIKLTHEQLKQHVHPEDMTIREKALKEAFETGHLHYQARVIWKDKSIHWMEGKGKVFYDEEKLPVKLMGTIRDITIEKKHQQELELSEESFRQLADTAPVLVWMSDINKSSYFFNKGWLNFTGRTMEEESGNGWTAGIHPEDAERSLSVCAKAFEKREAFYVEYRLKRHDGHYRWISEKGAPRFNTSGTFEGYVGACMDIDNEITNKQLLIENEQKFRLLADSMPQHIWTSDTEGKLNYFNKYVMEYSGQSLEHILENGWLEIVHPEDREENIKKWVHSIKTGENFLLEHRFRRYDGTYRWQLSRAVPQKDAKGRIQMWVGSSTDIQDQKTFSQELEKQVAARTKELELLNESLKKSEERYHLMVGEVQDYAIIYLNKEGIIENWNKGAEKIKGYTAKEIIGKNFSVFYTKSDQESNLPQFLLQEAAKNGRFGQEGWRVRKNGSPFWANVVITAIHGNDGTIIGFSKVTHDLTFKKEADDKIKINAAQLEQKNAELEKMNKELQSFAYISSHDLQEPLRKIQTFANQIAENEFYNLSENGKNKFIRMQKAAERMQTLINDLLAYSRTSTQERNFVKTQLNPIIDEVRENMKEELEQHHASITADVLCDVKIIPFQFEQLIYNLVSNSLKFAKEGVPPKISIKNEMVKGTANAILDPDTTYCHIHYNDNGIGFEQKYGERIFEVFQRLHGRELYQGTGIGLAIVKKIVDNHNGYITANGKPGDGAQFDIYIPA